MVGFAFGRSLDVYSHPQGLYPEVLLDPPFAVGARYGEGKYVSERFRLIIVKSGLHATSFRIGQIAGGPNGAWSTTDWFPILVKSSITLGAFQTSAAFLDARRRSRRSHFRSRIRKDNAPAGAQHCWANVVASVREEIVNLQMGDIPTVPFPEWSGFLEKRAEGACSEDMAKAFHIVVQEDSDQFARKTGSATDEVNGSSLGEAGMAQMEGVEEKEARSWVRYWSPAQPEVFSESRGEWSERLAKYGAILFVIPSGKWSPENPNAPN
ncbi:hypothetical protein HD554DRAFT_2035533 [Boletus coccyginus]|nr:hypothetical protein HD554DRAFT_2035533 [Boletus coccyginus]